MELQAHNNKNYTVTFNVSDAFEVVPTESCYIVMRNGYDGVQIFDPNEFLNPLQSAISREFTYEIIIDDSRTCSIILAFRLNVYNTMA